MCSCVAMIERQTPVTCRKGANDVLAVPVVIRQAVIPQAVIRQGAGSSDRVAQYRLEPLCVNAPWIREIDLVMKSVKFEARGGGELVQ